MSSRDSELATVVTAIEPTPAQLAGGRILLAYDAKALVTYGGAFFFLDGEHMVVQSIWIAPDYRGFGFGKILADTCKELGIRRALAPMSNAGQTWATRYGFAIQDDTITG